MRKDRMFNRECKRIAIEEPSLVAVDSPAESRTRTKYKSFSKVSTRFSFALQELKQDVQKAVPRHRVISGQAFWTELRLFDQPDAPTTDALCAAIEFDQDEDLDDSGCGDDFEDFDDSETEKSRKFGWREHVELYLERASQITEHDDPTTNVGETMSESFTQRAPGDANESEVTTSMLDFSLTSTMELDSMDDVVHKLIEQISDEMFSQPPPMEEPAKDIAAVPTAVAGNVPSDVGYSTASGQDEPVGKLDTQPSTQLPASSSVVSGKKATRRRKSEAAPAAPSAAIATAIVATPLNARPIPRTRSVLKKRSAYATEPPSMVKKSVTFSTTVDMSPYEERDTRKLADDSNILENTLPRQQSTPKVSPQKARGAKRKCVYDFYDDLEEETENEELAKSVEVSTQTDQSTSTAEMIRTIVEYTINSFKEAEENKSEEDSSREQAIKEILEHTKASFKVDETLKKKKRKRRKLDLLNDSIIQLHTKVDRLEKRERRRQRRPRPTCRLVVKKVVPAKAKPCTERCTQTDAPVTAEASVATTFELSKPPPKKRAPRKKTAKVKQPDDPEGGAPNPKRARRKDQQTIEECLNGEGGSTAAAADEIREPKKFTARKVVPDVVRMDDGQLVAQDSEDNLSREFEIEESLPPLSPPPSRTLVDPRLIKGAHRKPPSIIDTNQDSPALSSMPESPASQCSFPNNRAASDDESDSFTRNLIRLRIGPVPGHSSSSSIHAAKQKPRRLQPYPKSPKLRPPPTVPVARQYSFQTLYLGPEPPSAPTTLWKDPLIYPVDACKYIEQRLQPVLCETRLPTLQATYGNPCWFVSLKAAFKLLLDFTGDAGETQGTANMAVPRYPQFSQEFSPIAAPDGANHFVDDEDDGERGHDSGSDVPDD